MPPHGGATVWGLGSVLFCRLLGTPRSPAVVTAVAQQTQNGERGKVESSKGGSENSRLANDPDNMRAPFDTTSCRTDLDSTTGGQ